MKMRYLLQYLSSLIFMLAYRVFRSSFAKRSRKRHTLLMKIFRFCAENNSVKALSVYGHLLHFRGEGVDNKIQGALYLQRAADQGEAKSQYQMGRIFEEGFAHYFQPNADKAFNYYHQAAHHGHLLAITRLISVYEQGELGQSVDPVAAARWQDQRLTLPTVA